MFRIRREQLEKFLEPKIATSQQVILAGFSVSEREQMAACHVAHIDERETGLREHRKLSFQKPNDDRAGWSRAQIVLSDGCARQDGNDGSALRKMLLDDIVCGQL